MLHRGKLALFGCQINPDVRYQQVIESEQIRLHRNDGESVLQWVERLHSEREILGFKSSADSAPKDSGLAENAFVLMIQTKYQKEIYEKYGHTFAGLDATHNTTHYENTSLFTVVVRDRWGHGKTNLFSFHECVTNRYI